MPQQPQGTALQRTPALLASVGKLVIVADRGGWILGWPWPGAPGPAIRAHDDGGPVAAIGADLVTSGGWDPRVIRWDLAAMAPRYTARPFDGRVTALCVRGDELLVAGADKAAGSPSSTKDQAPLQPGRVVTIAADGTVGTTLLTARGEIRGLVCGSGWLAAIDQADTARIIWARGGDQGALALESGPATALADGGSGPIAADSAGLWKFDLAGGGRSAIARFDDDHPQVGSLLALGDSVFGTTSEALVRWPGGTHITREGAAPLALARYDDGLLVLWDDGLLEQRDASGQKLIHSAQVPQER
jgi:hypothetical protein